MKEEIDIVEDDFTKLNVFSKVDVVISQCFKEIVPDPVLAILIRMLSVPAVADAPKEPYCNFR